MNCIIIMGRLTRDPETKTVGEKDTMIANFTVAVDRRFKREGQDDANYFRCAAIGKLGEFVDRNLKQGTKIVVRGSMENNRYKNRDGQMVDGWQISCDEIKFAESKKAQGGGQTQEQAKEKAAKADPAPAAAAASNFVPVEDEDDELPFN